MTSLLPTLLCCLGAAGLVPAQGEAARPAPPDTVVGLAVVRLPVLAGEDDDRLRLRRLRGQAAAPGNGLLRAPSTLAPALGGEGAPEPADLAGVRASALAPRLHTVWNSDLPFSLNEGPLWAGRGLSVRLTAGVRLEGGPVTVILAPELVHERNRPFQTFSFPETGDERRRHRLASPFHYPPGSADVPLRFGTGPRTLIDPGQSSLTVEAGPAAVGAATENLWWGPGVRNALVLSAHAPGVPHLFLRTARPLETGVGTLEGRWIVGRLSESGWFDFDATNDHRSLSALAVVFSPGFASGLHAGLARAVYAPSGSVPLGAAFDVFRSVGRPFAAEGDTLLSPGPDQIFSLFARWGFPAAGLELYGEWARYEQPAGLRDFFEVPQRSRGYTVGLQHARPVDLGFAAGDETLRLQVEHTSLEPSSAYRIRPFGEWYASRRVPQGYTHRGRVLGAAVGPSGSGQWLAVDVFGARWRAGSYLGRIRWENQARFTYFREFRRSDVSLFLGLRGGADVGPLRVAAEYVPGVRLNYLFQAQELGHFQERGVDIRNHTLKLTLSMVTLRL